MELELHLLELQYETILNERKRSISLRVSREEEKKGKKLNCTVE